MNFNVVITQSVNRSFSMRFLATNYQPVLGYVPIVGAGYGGGGEQYNLSCSDLQMR